MGKVMQTTPNFNYISSNNKASAVIEFTNTSFVSGNTYVLKYNNIAIGSFTANTGDNVKNLVKAINSNSKVSDIDAKVWWSNNASNTYYVQLNFSQNGNWKNAAFSMTLNGGATTSIYSVKRGMGYGTASKGQMVYGSKSYELSNHLGNVLEVITDRKFGVDDGVYNPTTGAKTSATLDGQVDFYIAQIQSYADYDPFGTVQTSRSGNFSSMTRGFNGKLKDDELKGEGNSYDFGARMYDPRIGRWFKTDDFDYETPSWTPYRFGFDNPIFWIDTDGNREFPSYSAYEKYAKKMKLKILKPDELWKQGHWLTYHRTLYLDKGIRSDLGKNYRQANYRNTNKLISSEYRTVNDRQDYYKWADDYSNRLGHEVKWFEAAYLTVAKLLLLEMNEVIASGNSNKEIIDFVEKGNKAILDDMMPKIKELFQEQKAVTGERAYQWDAQALSDEQNIIIQKYYDKLSKENVNILQKMVEIDGFKGNILDPGDRWVYGMKKMGYEVTKKDMPSAGGCWENVKNP